VDLISNRGPSRAKDSPQLLGKLFLPSICFTWLFTQWSCTIYYFHLYFWYDHEPSLCLWSANDTVSYQSTGGKSSVL